MVIVRFDEHRLVRFPCRGGSRQVETSDADHRLLLCRLF
jgi:hypothetical protein